MPTPKQIDKLLQERYYLSTETTWEQVAERISKLHPPILDYIKNKEFIPSSPTIMNANTDGERYGTLSSCFPMKIEDSIDGIMDTMKEIAQVTKMGGGCGLMFDNIRGANEMIGSVGKNSGDFKGCLSYDNETACNNGLDEIGIPCSWDPDSGSCFKDANMNLVNDDD
jgi:hypothetical protein